MPLRWSVDNYIVHLTEQITLSPYSRYWFSLTEWCCHRSIEQFILPGWCDGWALAESRRTTPVGPRCTPCRPTGPRGSTDTVSKIREAVVERTLALSKLGNPGAVTAPDCVSANSCFLCCSCWLIVAKSFYATPYPTVAPNATQGLLRPIM